MNDDQRRVLAGLLASALRTRFEGNKKAAYTAVGVNPATFDRALNALPIRDDRATRIINELWPEARGDVDRIPRDPAVDEGFSDDRAKIIVGDFEAWVKTTEVLSDFQRRAVLKAMEVAERNPGRSIVVPPEPLSEDPSTNESSVKAAHDDVEPIERGQGHDENA